MAERRRSIVAELVGATIVLSIATAIVVAHRDPSWLGCGLWVAGMGSALVAAVVHDRRSGPTTPVAEAIGWRRMDTVVLVGLGVGAFVLRAHRLGSVLPPLHGDEGEMGLLARRVLDPTGVGAPPLPVFGTGFLDHPTLFHYVQAAALVVFGDSLMGLRMLSAAAGAAGVSAVFVVGRLGWGRPAGVAAGWLLGVSHFDIQYSRLALNNIESSSLITLAMAMTMAAITLAENRDAPPDRSLALFVWIGLTVGVSQYFYFGSRLLLVLIVPTSVLVYRHGVARWRELAAGGGALVVAVLPLAHHFLEHPIVFVSRSRGVSVLSSRNVAHELGDDATLPGDLWPLLTAQLRRNLSFFTGAGDRTSFYTSALPAFDRISLALFWIGLAIVIVSAVAARSEPRLQSRLILLWLIVGVTFGGVLTTDSPNGPRLLMVVPAVCVCGGVAAQRCWRVLGRRWPERWRAVAGAAALAMIALLITNWNRYFVDYASLRPSTPVTEVATFIRDRSSSHRVFLVGGDDLRVGHGVVQFITDGGDQADLSSADDLDGLLADDLADRRPVLIVALANHVVELDRVERRLPGGHRDTYTDDGRLLFVTYSVSLP